MEERTEPPGLVILSVEQRKTVKLEQTEVNMVSNFISFQRAKGSTERKHIETNKYTA